MKKKILTGMLFVVIVVMMFSGCGNSADSNGSVEKPITRMAVYSSRPNPKDL